MTLEIKAVGKPEKLWIDRNQTEYYWAAHDPKEITSENVWMKTETTANQTVGGVKSSPETEVHGVDCLHKNEFYKANKIALWLMEPKQEKS